MNSKLIYFSFSLLNLFASYGEYNEFLKSPDIIFQYEGAKKYFNNKKYNQAIVLLEEIVPLMKGTAYAEESLYLLAQSYYAQKDYAFAAEHFKNYYTSFPKGKYSESAHLYSLYSLYLESPNVHFDQSDTYKAIQQSQDFLEHYPYSKKKETVQCILIELQEKLALKELIAVRLYYNLGNYILYPFQGNNYLACVITAQNALQSYPLSKYREDFMYYIFLAKYKMALQNIKKKNFRCYDVVNEYYFYLNNYPLGKHLKEIQKLYNKINCGFKTK